MEAWEYINGHQLSGRTCLIKISVETVIVTRELLCISSALINAYADYAMHLDFVITDMKWVSGGGPV